MHEWIGASRTDEWEVDDDDDCHAHTRGSNEDEDDPRLYRSDVVGHSDFSGSAEHDENDENEDEKYGDNVLGPVWFLELEEWAGVRAASRKHVRIGDYMMGILAGDDEGENVGRDDC